MFALNWSIKSSIFGEYLFMRLEKIKKTGEREMRFWYDSTIAGIFFFLTRELGRTIHTKA